MTKTEMLNDAAALLAWYERNSAADLYTVGFVFNGQLYSVTRAQLEAAWLKADRASSKRGGFLKLRVRLSATMKAALVASGEARCWGSADLLETADKWNRGERWERLVTEDAGQRWVKDSVPFWVAGDLEVNGQQVQVKFDGAELTNVVCMARSGLA